MQKEELNQTFIIVRNSKKKKKNGPPEPMLWWYGPKLGVASVGHGDFTIHYL